MILTPRQNDSDGREDLEYRLLHIYVSAKKRTKLGRRQKH